MKIFNRFSLSPGLLFSLGIALFYAFDIVNSRFILKEGENPLNLATWLNLIILLPWLLIFKKHSKAFFHLTKRHILLLIIIGITGSIGVDYLQSLALANTSATNFSFLYRTVVVFTVVFAWFFFKEKITWQKILLTTFILIGSFFLTTNGKGISLTLGDIYTLLVAASAAFVSNILIKHTVAHMHPDLSGSAISIFATITLLVVAISTKTFAFPHNIFLIILGGIFAFFLTMSRNRAYKHASASFVTMVVSIAPLFVTTLSFFLLKESLGLFEIIGGIIIVGSTIFVEYLQI